MGSVVTDHNWKCGQGPHEYVWSRATWVRVVSTAMAGEVPDHLGTGGPDRNGLLSRTTLVQVVPTAVIRVVRDHMRTCGPDRNGTCCLGPHWYVGSRAKLVRVVTGHIGTAGPERSGTRGP